MTTKRLARWCLVAATLALLVPTSASLMVQPVHASGTGTTYYVDTVFGGPNCNGEFETSDPNGINCPFATIQQVHAKTFAASDFIRFEDGDQWSDTGTNPYFLDPGNGGSGNSGTGVITITDYCYAPTQPNHSCSPKPPLPLLKGNGDLAVVELSNQQGWTISDLEITNWPQAGCPDDPPNPADPGMPSSCYGQRSGVLVYAKDPQPTAHGVLTTLSNITLQGLTISHVLGQYGSSSSQITPANDPNNLTGGIVFDIEKNGTADDVYTAWATVNVIGNTISDVWRSGLVFHSQWGGDVYSGQHCQQLYDENNGWDLNHPSIGINVFQNHLSNIGGNGIVVGVSSQAIVQANTLVGGDQDQGGGVAGMWTFDSSTAKVEENTVTGMADSGSGAQAYDTDYCETGDLVEYNFSYSNPSGFLLAMPQSTTNIIRYNISQDDGTHSWFLTNYKGSTDGTVANGDVFYNNDVYVPSGSGYNGLVQAPNELWTTPPVFDNNVLDVLNDNKQEHDMCAIPSSWTQVSLNTFNGTYCGIPVPAGNQHTDPAFLYPGLAGYDGFGSSCQPPSCYPPQTAYYYATQAPASSPLICYSAFVQGQGNDGGRDYIDVQLPPDAPPNKIDGGALEVSNGNC